MKQWGILNAEPENYSPQAVEIISQVGELRLEQQDREGLLRQYPVWEA